MLAHTTFAVYPPWVAGIPLVRGTPTTPHGYMTTDSVVVIAFLLVTPCEVITTLCHHAGAQEGNLFMRLFPLHYVPSRADHNSGIVMALRG